MTEHTPTVLAVDDEPGLPALYEAWLADDYSVLTASDGQEALGKLCEGIDVIILDRNMPTMPGEVFLRRCRDQGWDCRVLMVTGKEPDGDVLSLGFDAYLVKPVGRQTLQSHVSMLMRRQRYSEKVKEYFAISSKLSILDVETLNNGNQETYQDLLSRRDELEDEIHLLATEFDRDDVEAEFRQLTGPAGAG